LSYQGVGKWVAAMYIPSGTNESFVFYNQQTNRPSLYIDGDNDFVGVGFDNTNSIIPSAQIHVLAIFAAYPALIAQAAPSQSASIQEWWDSSNSPLAKVYKGGAFSMPNLPTGSGTPPGGLVAGDLWVDTTLGSHQGVVKIY
jgi:hypothetical protein